MKPFCFRQFEVYDHLSTMKVGTDGATLGAYSSRRQFDTALDVGTGCGLIALMLAQKSLGEILAIDIDIASVLQAEENFNQSVWSKRLSAQQISVQQLAKESPVAFDLIVSNPPYFVDSLQSADERKTIARHDTTLSHADLAASVKALLSSNGYFDIILPFDVSLSFESLMFSENFYLCEELLLSSFAGQKPMRRIMTFSKSKPNTVISSNMAIRADAHRYTKVYRDFTIDFFPSLPFAE